MPAMSTAQKTRSGVTLQGSAQMVAEFFTFGVHSILYQRGIFPPESFQREEKYELPLWVSTEAKVKEFVEQVTKQCQEWLEQRRIKKLVLVLTAVDTEEVLERWDFSVQYERSEDAAKENKTKNDGGEKTSGQSYKNESRKDLKEIKKEIREVIRQITASVTFLPLIDRRCSFDILVYTHNDTEMPKEWADSGPCLIDNAQCVPFRSFSSGIHKVDTAVSYKCDD